MFNKKLKQELLESESNRQKLETDIAALINRNEVLKRQLETMISELDHSKRRYDLLLQDMGKREQASGEVSRLATRDANDIINTAHTNADIIIREALSSAREVLVEISRISNESHELKGKLGVKLKTMEAILEGLELPEAPDQKLLDEDYDTSKRK